MPYSCREIKCSSSRYVNGSDGAHLMSVLMLTEERLVGSLSRCDRLGFVEALYVLRT